MKVFTSSIRLSSDAKTAEVNITEPVEAIVFESGVKEGTALIFTGHTTASVHLMNKDTNLEKDFHDFLNGLIPNRPDYRHNKGDFGRNADAHIKSTVVGCAVSVPVTKGRLALGQWQAVYFSEFDGPRNRLISIKVMGE